jgi:ABC-2 type transport system ATP-binding protein
MLEVRRLTKRYGALVGIQDLSFDVRPGEVLGLLGPNGSGKSTTVKILMGLLRPTSGEVLLDGTDALARLHTYKAMLGYVPEEPHLYSYLTGPEYLRLVGRLRQLPEHALDGKSIASCSCSASTTIATRRSPPTRKACVRRF